ncbi:MAG: VWA domain-containing protein [Pyrinomonadaceae bacterium]
MKRTFTTSLTFVLLLTIVVAQSPQKPQEPASDEILRIQSELVQVDAVVMDKNDQVIPDLKLEDFKVYENGKRQDLKFLEFVSVETGPRTEGTINVAGQPIEPDVARNLSQRDLRRVFAFVIDDLTIPYEDVVNIRKLLNDFVNNKMREGDLVAIVRVAGGRGLLQQFTSDKQLLRRAIDEITPTLNAYSAFHNLDPVAGINTRPALAPPGDDNTSGGIAEVDPFRGADVDASAEGITRGMRSLSALSTAGDVINGMKTLPGRKSLVLISGGLPLIETTQNQIKVNGVPTNITETRSMYTNVSYLLRQLTDRASRAGVVINTLNIRSQGGVKGVSSFTDPGNEGRSALMPNAGGDATFGRTADLAQFDNQALDSLSGNLGLQALAGATGGLAVTNTNNFGAGLDRILARSSYYLLAYRPTEAFNGKFHKLEIKVERPGAKVYSRNGFVATADIPGPSLTKEQTIIRAAMSPLARRDVDLNGILQYRYLPNSEAAIDINLQMAANGLTFKQGADSKYQTTFDVVGFLINDQGKTQSGFSETVNSSLTPAEYARAQANGIGYIGHVDLPPGSYQLRAIVRDTETGRLGTMSKYIEVPDISKKRLTVSSLFLFAADPAQGNKAKPEPLTALRQLPRSQDLRYAAIIYNPKVGDGKTQLLARVIISRGDKVLLQEKDQPVTGAVQDGQVAKFGQFGLSKAQPGRYVLTLVVTDPQASEKERIVVRSMDFILVD